MQCLLALSTLAAAAQVYTVDCGVKRGPLPHMWESTGFCPPCSASSPGRRCGSHRQGGLDYNLGEDMWQNLVLMGSIPNRGRWQVRVHFLLELVGGKDAQGAYNFTDLDTFFDRLKAERLKPGLELMGSPGGVFTSFDDPGQVAEWREMVRQLARHYIDRYGVEEVREWNFELWNEIANGDWDMVEFTPQGYCNYYDACAAGLADADPRLRLGGDSACNFGKPYCGALLQHMLNGTSFFGGAVRQTDFVGTHAKGSGDKDAVWTILRKEYEWVEELRTRFPSFINVSFFNDEADPLGGWSRAEEWRSDTRYAVMMAKSVELHLSQWINSHNTTAPSAGISYALMSFDNGFLNYNRNNASINIFDQRTLVSRFQMNHSTPVVFETVKKQSINTHTLLSLLGDTQLSAEPQPDPSEAHTPPTPLPWAPKPEQAVVLGSMAGGDREVAGLFMTGQDAVETGGEVTITMQFTNLPSALAVNTTRSALYVLQDKGGGYGVWVAAGRPAFPSAEQLAAMRRGQELAPSSVEPLVMNCDAADCFQKSLTLPRTSLALLHLCARPPHPPGRIDTPPRILHVSPNSTLLSWDDVEGRCLSTYEVVDETGRRLNSDNLIMTAWLYAHGGKPAVSLRVRGVDYWGRAGALSQPITL
eukprot:Hpha_TRINITY_DN24063_c0_g1::TRINITY_DN24063_c0_g1_i1::g.130468::m.130468/K01217/IDUA; L-iduronidase